MKNDKRLLDMYFDIKKGLKTLRNGVERLTGENKWIGEDQI